MSDSRGSNPSSGAGATGQNPHAPTGQPGPGPGPGLGGAGGAGAANAASSGGVSLNGQFGAPGSPGAVAGRGPVASVVMATRNRKDELRNAIASCAAQSVPVEVIIRDDGSTDGTDEMVAREFPWVDYARSASPRGSIANRNDAVVAARCPVIFSIDDDATFPSPHTVAQTLAEFDHPRVGAVAIPYIDVLKSPQVQQRARDDRGIYLLNFFRGCAAAWRRDVFLAVGGYSPVLYHMAEEPDLGMKMLNAGFVTRLGRADPVHHFESPRRDVRRVLQQTARNGVLLGVLNAPGVILPAHIVGSAVKSVIYGIRTTAKTAMATGVLEGYRMIPRAWASRRPMSLGAYLLYRKIGRFEQLELGQIERDLPPLAPGLDQPPPRPRMDGGEAGGGAGGGDGGGAHGGAGAGVGAGVGAAASSRSSEGGTGPGSGSGGSVRVR